jgi:hypothetical protein
VLRVPNWSEEFAERAALAREFNNWVVDPNGWLRDYHVNNVVAFDLFDVLTEGGASNLLRYPTVFEGAIDSHPSAEGNARAAAAFVPFMNRAVRRAGLSR